MCRRTLVQLSPTGHLSQVAEASIREEIPLSGRVTSSSPPEDTVNSPSSSRNQHIPPRHTPTGLGRLESSIGNQQSSDTIANSTPYDHDLYPYPWFRDLLTLQVGVCVVAAAILFYVSVYNHGGNASSGAALDFILSGCQILPIAFLFLELYVLLFLRIDGAPALDTDQLEQLFQWKNRTRRQWFVALSRGTLVLVAIASCISYTFLGAGYLLYTLPAACIILVVTIQGSLAVFDRRNHVISH